MQPQVVDENGNQLNPNAPKDHEVAISQLAKSEEFFRLVVDSVADYAIFALDTEGHIVTWNVGAKRFKGYEAHEVIGTSFKRFYTKEDIDRRHPEYELKFAKETGRYEEEGWRVRKDGTNFWANVVITKLTNASGKHIGFAKVTRDLTERKSHEERLKDSEEKLRLMIQSVKDYAIFMLSPEGLISSWNEGAERNKFYKAHEIIGKHFRIFYPETDKQEKKPEYELEVAAEVGRFEDTGWRVRKDGSRFWANVIISAIKNSKGDLIGFTKVTRDLTSQKEADEKLIASYAALERTVHERTKELIAAKHAAENANTAKSTFLANMSHEIRTPLGAIMGFAGLIGSADVSKSDVANYVSIVKRNSEQLLRIIDDILDLSKVEAGRMDIELIQFSLPEVLSDMASMLGLRARENSIRFELNAETSIPNFVISDPTRLRQIIINVVGNAIKFTNNGDVKVSVSFEDNLLKLVVKDTGRGISEDQAAKLFQPFTQADSATNRKFGGTGLGLALTKGLCEAMGGDFILFESTLGRGSTFIATIKMDVPSNTGYTMGLNARYGSEASSDDQVQVLSGMKILLVEDSPDNQVLIQILLSKVGADIDIASDGVEGVKKAMAGNYDVVLMDVQMPRMDGMEAISILRTKDYKTPVIALTAHAMKEHKTRALEAGFIDFLSKPIQLSAMVELLKTFKDAKKAPPQT